MDPVQTAVDFGRRDPVVIGGDEITRLSPQKIRGMRFCMDQGQTNVDVGHRETRFVGRMQREHKHGFFLKIKESESVDGLDIDFQKRFVVSGIHCELSCSFSSCHDRMVFCLYSYLKPSKENPKRDIIKMRDLV